MGMKHKQFKHLKRRDLSNHFCIPLEAFLKTNPSIMPQGLCMKYNLYV